MNPVGLSEAEFAGIVSEFCQAASTISNPRSVGLKWETERGGFYIKTSAQDLRTEADCLEAFSAAHARVGPVEFVGYDSTRNVLVTRFAGGDSGFNVAWNRVAGLRRWLRRKPAEPLGFVADVARWAADFHTGTSLEAEQAPDCLNTLFETLLRKTRWLQDEGNDILRPSDLRIVERWAQDRLDEDLWAGQVLCMTHGDLCLSNLLVSNTTTRVLDFADARPGFALEDLARLWCTTWEVIQAADAHRTHEPHLTEVLRSYGADPSLPTSAPWQFLRVLNALIRLAEAPLLWQHLDLASRLIHRRLVKAQGDCLHELVPPVSIRLGVR